MIALAHGDGTDWPNYALMTLGTHLRSVGEDVRLIRLGDERQLWDRTSRIFGSSVFSHSRKVRAVLEREWGEITWGGTGIWKWEETPRGPKVTDMGPSMASVGAPEPDAIAPDYSLYPGFTASMGFTQRGCRLGCKFCVVPEKEGKPRSVRTIAEIWRGKGHRKNLLLLDNDPFGQPAAEWRARLREIREGGFRVCFAQGINVRLVDEEAARELATVRYSSTKFKGRRLYVAWDNIGDEEVFKAGIATLEGAGIPPHHVMSYMLVGFVKGEMWGDIFHRFNELVALGALPYPMVFDRERAKTCKACKDLPERTERCPKCNGHPDPLVRAHVNKLRAFARWASTGLYRAIPWDAYDVRIKRTRAEKARPA